MISFIYAMCVVVHIVRLEGCAATKRVFSPPAMNTGMLLYHPYASWRCDYEGGNLSWAPQSGLTAQRGEWVGVCGGRGVRSVKP
jgi:hypothetical protein